MLWDGDIFSEMERLRREVNSLFSNYGRSAGTTTYPLMNVYDDKECVVVTAELPGLTREQINIVYSDGTLTVSGKQEPLARAKKMAVVRRERSEGPFEKMVRIPTKINQEKIAASFSNGILTITLPKAEEARPRTITIEAR